MFIIFLAESVPKFDTILELIGGSSHALLSFVFPYLYYLYLSAAEKNFDELAKNPSKNSLNKKTNPNNNNNDSYSENYVFSFKE